ncbi:MAG: DUF6261 family protein [Bacteroidales bacterium]|nr:DUF6261 family protein [Bacteroidales bacterium]
MKKIPFSIFNVDGMYRLASSIINKIKKTTIDDTDFAKLLSIGIGNLTVLEQAMLKNTTKVYTNTIYKLDQLFDDSYKSLKLFIRVYIHTADVVKKNAANILWELIRKHGTGLNNFGYTKQISRAQNLLAEIDRDPRNKKAVKVIACETFIADMKDRLDNLIGGIEERNTFIASLPDVASQESEKELVANLKNICAYIQVKSLVSEIATWKDLETELNVIIDENVKVARLSRSREIAETDIPKQ